LSPENSNVLPAGGMTSSEPPDNGRGAIVTDQAGIESLLVALL